MIDDIDALVASYERGALSRRELLAALVLAAASPAAAAQAPAGLTHARNLHHINLQVADVARSERFYRELFGLPPTRVVQGPDNHGFDLPGGGIVILQRSPTPGRIDHFCLGVDGFDADRMRAAARAAAVDGVQGTAADNFFVRDPDGIRVQLSAPDWSA
jgi:catechol 2,3-dioxygenase-like lactoylglutathione lyase family enzyme